eukprot:jgi/Psemu1/30273/gm1.30273_g
MTNGLEYYFKFMENLFKTLKQIDGYVTSIELRMQVAATQFCNCENEGILMYMIHKNWVEKHISDDDRMREQDWAEAGDKSVKEMAEKYRNTEQHTINLSKMKDRGKKRKLEGMVDKIWKLKFCPKKGAECHFREFDALWEETHTTCDYDVPIEICMQKAMCAILIAKLPWNVTNKANLEWWNRMSFIERENVWEAFKFHWICCLEKIKNEDETNPFFPANGDDSDIDNNEKVNDGRDEIKAPHGWNKVCKRCADKKAKKKCRYCKNTCSKGVGDRVPCAAQKMKFVSGNKRNSPNKKKLKKAEEASKEENKSGNRQKGKSRSKQLYSNSKEALEILLEKMGKEKPIDGEIDLEDETLEQCLERIAASHNMTVEELLVENNILKDGNPENLPDKKIEPKGRKKGNYREVSSNDNSNENGKAEEDTMKVEEGDELQEERSTHSEEEDKKNEEEAASERDPIEVATDPALQLGDTDNIEEKAAKATDPIENNEQEEKKKTWKHYLPMEKEDKKNEKEAANYTAQIEVATNPTLQEDNTDKNKEAAANDTDPIAVAADCALQEGGTKNMEE